MDSKYLSWGFLEVIGVMFNYYDGSKHRSNKAFFRTLWGMLNNQETPTIDEVFDTMNPQYADTTRIMLKNGLKRTGRFWLEGLDGDVFGKRFEEEYIFQWTVYNKSEKERLKTRDR